METREVLEHVERAEVAAFADYDYVVVNDELAGAVDRLRSIVTAERARLVRMRELTETIVRTFSGESGN